MKFQYDESTKLISMRRYFGFKKNLSCSKGKDGRVYISLWDNSKTPSTHTSMAWDDWLLTANILRDMGACKPAFDVSTIFNIDFNLFIQRVKFEKSKITMCSRISWTEIHIPGFGLFPQYSIKNGLFLLVFSFCNIVISTLGFFFFFIIIVEMRNIQNYSNARTELHKH